MSKAKKQGPVFKAYPQNQLSLLPPSWEELIPEHHSVRLLNHVIDQLDMEPLLRKYSSKGASSFHPRMMLKVLIYAYLNNIYSSRKIEAALGANIHFMWISGNARPDHNTINRFRSDKLKGVLKEIFTQVVKLMVAQNLVSLEKAYLDGTKLEANANRYTFVWGKRMKNNRTRIGTQLEELWSYAETLAESELVDTAPTSFEAADPEAVRQTIEKLDAALKDKPVSKKVKQKLRYAKKNWPDKLAEYDQKEEILGDRNSYSKTDPDATFMRMKEDHMGNGQLKPAYNWQISTSDQYILNYSIHQQLADTQTLEPHLDDFETCYKTKPSELCADAGYGSEQNYEYLEEKEITPYVKYNYFHKEQTKKWQEDPSKQSNLYYNEAQDYYVCPMGQHMHKIGSETRINRVGYEQEYDIYQARNCKGCPMRGACHKAKGNRTISVNKNLLRHKNKVRKLLLSEQGLAHRSKRPVDVETVFGNIKHNKNFKRFMLRGQDKVLIEVGLLSLAHNLAKMVKN